jgi:predicted nucleic acid-binding protein
MKAHVLDANALYRYLTRGPGAATVSQLFKEARDAGELLRMSVVNWGEVFYTLSRFESFSRASRIMENVLLLPLAVVDADKVLTATAAKLKSSYGLPYADCFAAALAIDNAVLVTSDVKDFKRLPGLKILELPEHKPRRS